MAKKSSRSALLAGALLGLASVAALALHFSHSRLKRKLYYLYTGTSDPVVLLEEKTPPATHIAYGPDPLQFGELSLPASGSNFPVAILIHGGCWAGRPGDRLTSLDPLRPLSAALTAQGFAVWNVEYRRMLNPGGGWPGTYNDLSRATDFLTTLAAANHLDLSHVIAIGHSSGGQLALWLAARKQLPPTSEIYDPAPLPISGVVDIDGPPSLAAFSTLDDRPCTAHVIQAFLGGTPQQVPTRYQQGSADGLLPSGVPQELLYSGNVEFFSTNESLWARQFTTYTVQAEAAGDTIHLTRLNKAGHVDGIDPHSKSWPLVLARIKALL